MPKSDFQLATFLTYRKGVGAGLQVDTAREKRFAQAEPEVRICGFPATILDPGIRITFSKSSQG